MLSFSAMLLFPSCILQDELADFRSVRNQLEHAVGAAIEHMGPETVLAILPLNLPGVATAGGAAASSAGAAALPFDQALMTSRSWLLPLLKERVKKASLGFFWTHLHPAATSLHALRQTAVQVL